MVVFFFHLQKYHYKDGTCGYKKRPVLQILQEKRNLQSNGSFCIALYDL
ncbi:MAG: hypothetical protein NTX65_06720 [Ignavibacteriales bacterium]|nr:hypothetical protein [Ignavibacteriales bacterium]